MEDLETYFLKVIAAHKNKTGNTPDFLIKGEPPNKIRLLFRNKIEPSISFGDWTVITVSPKDFASMGKIYPAIVSKMRKKDDK